MGRVGNGFIKCGALAIFLFAPSVLAWGPLGHRMVAETAAILVADDLPEWAPLFGPYRTSLGIYANLPDSLFKHTDGHEGQLEGPTHYLDVDVIQGALGPHALYNLPATYTDAVKRLNEKLGKAEATKIGSSPWRIKQLFKLAQAKMVGIQELSGRYQTGEASTGDAADFYQGLYFLGLMSHYTGDATMPYHATSDWDGLLKQEQGIHFYFENNCVNVLEPGLSSDVRDAVRRNQKKWSSEWLGSGTKSFNEESAIKVAFAVFLDSKEAIDSVSKVDREKVILAVEPKVKRRDDREGCIFFRPILVEQLAKGAFFTATLWKAALPKKANLAHAASLQFINYLANPSYLVPDYLDN